MTETGFVAVTRDWVVIGLIFGVAYIVCLVIALQVGRNFMARPKHRISSSVAIAATTAGTGSEDNGDDNYGNEFCDDVTEHQDDDFRLYLRPSYPVLYIITTVVTASVLALLLLPVSIVAVQFSIPQSKWTGHLELESSIPDIFSLFIGSRLSLMERCWNVLFIVGHVTAFILIPFAHFYSETAADDDSGMKRLREVLVLMFLVGFMVFGLSFALRSLLPGMNILNPQLIIITISSAATTFLACYSLAVGMRHWLIFSLSLAVDPRLKQRAGEKALRLQMERETIQARLEKLDIQSKTGQSPLDTRVSWSSMAANTFTMLVRRASSNMFDHGTARPTGQSIDILRESVTSELRQLQSNLKALDRRIKELDKTRHIHVWRRNFAFLTSTAVFFICLALLVVEIVAHLVPFSRLIGMGDLPGRYVWVEISQVLLISAVIIIGSFWPGEAQSQQQLNSRIWRTNLPFVLVRSSLLLLLAINLPITLKFLNVTRFQLYGICRHPELFVTSRWPFVGWALRLLTLILCLKSVPDAAGRVNQSRVYYT